MRMTSFLLCLLLTACTGVLRSQSSDLYRRETDAWHARRLAALTAEDGWLNLAGLHWLQEGEQRFGSDSGHAIVFPPGRIAGSAGRFIRTGQVVVMESEPGVGIQVDGRPGRCDTLLSPTRPVSAACAAGTLRWTVIQRGDRIGIRLRDLAHPSLSSFRGVDRFPIDSNLRVTAKLIADTYNRSIPVSNVLGQTVQMPSPGRLVFRLGDRDLTLDALREGDELFIIFGDATSGEETYPAGRFLYAAMPDSDGMTVLDFNRAIDPPCAFTPHATCPLPPKQNMLPVSVRAGEKDYHH